MYTFSQPDYSEQNAKYWYNLKNKAKHFPCISDVLKYLEQNYGEEDISILVTGSLHLVGEVLRTIKD